MDLLILILQGVIVAATPLVFAAIGELVVERAGVLNLGIEGMMILGAILMVVVIFMPTGLVPTLARLVPGGRR